MKTYRQIKRRKEFHAIKDIAYRLDNRDLKENNPNYNGLYEDEDGNFTTGWLNRTYWSDIWYLFDLLEWSRQKRWTL